MDMHISSSALPWECLITRSSHVINHCANLVRSRLILIPCFTPVFENNVEMVIIPLTSVP